MIERRSVKYMRSEFFVPEVAVRKKRAEGIPRLTSGPDPPALADVEARVRLFSDRGWGSPSSQSRPAQRVASLPASSRANSARACSRAGKLPTASARCKASRAA
jgi:hypothetical protein